MDKAHHASGSTRTCGIPLSRSATRLRRLQGSRQSTYKTQTKCRQNRKCRFFNRSTSITYNFSPLKCLNSPGADQFPLPWGEGQGEGQTGSSFFRGSSHHPLSLREKVRMRDKLVIPFRIRSAEKNLSILYRTGQNGTNSAFQKNRPRCTNDLRRHRLQFVPFWTLELPWGLEIGAWRFGGKLCQSCAIPVRLSWGGLLRPLGSPSYSQLSTSCSGVTFAKPLL